MKGGIAILCLFLCAAATSASAQSTAPAPEGEPKRTIRFATDFDAPPFSFREGNQPKGFEIDLGHALAGRLGAEVEWVRMNFSPILNFGEILPEFVDAAISSITITEERKNRVAFSRSYFRTSLAAAARADTAWEHADFTWGLKGKGPVGVMRDTTSEAWAKKNLNAEIKTYPTPEALVRALHGEGEIYCVLLDEGILSYLLKSDAKAKIVERGLQREDYGIAVKKDDRKLLKELNDALEKMNEDGTYAALYEKWFGRRRELPPQ